jgi:hypothetical protein
MLHNDHYRCASRLGVFAFLMQAEQSIAVGQKTPGGSDSPQGLILQHGERSLWKAVKRVEANEIEADIILSTAHKSKGSEVGFGTASARS